MLINRPKDRVKKIVLTIIISAGALLPTWLFIVGRSFLTPENFFQEFFVLGHGLMFLGISQLSFLVALFFSLKSIWE